MNFIQCNTCHRYFKPFDGGDTAMECATEICEPEGTIRGFYGSTLFDGNVGKWIIKQPAHVGFGLICDSCLAAVWDEIEITTSMF